MPEPATDLLAIVRDLRATINPLNVDTPETRAARLDELRARYRETKSQDDLDAIKKHLAEGQLLLTLVTEYCKLERVAALIAAHEVIAPPLPRKLHARELRKAFEAMAMSSGKMARDPIGDFHSTVWAEADAWLSTCMQSVSMFDDPITPRMQYANVFDLLRKAGSSASFLEADRISKIAADTSKAANERLDEIHAEFPGYVGQPSRWWGELLGVRRQAIEKTRFFMTTRKEALKQIAAERKARHREDA